MSLIPLLWGRTRYAKLLTQADSPICEIKLRSCQYPSMSKKNRFEVACRLRDEYRPKHLIAPRLFGNFDGTGTSESKEKAAYIAISEALERWAWWELSNGTQSREYSFDKINSTIGLAAHPSPFPSSAREFALLESHERALLRLWKIGKISARKLELQFPSKKMNAIELLGPDQRIHTILIRELLPQGFVLACSSRKSQTQALHHAYDEIQRNIAALQSISNIRSNKLQLNTWEESYLRQFETSLDWTPDAWESSLRTHQRPEKFHVEIDRECKGPWNSFASVWRHLYKENYIT